MVCRRRVLCERGRADEEDTVAGAGVGRDEGDDRASEPSRQEHGIGQRVRSGEYQGYYERNYLGR